MNHLPHNTPDPDADAEAQAIADLETLDRKLRGKKSQAKAMMEPRPKARPVAFIGIDPGATGCAALIHDGGHNLFDWPGDPALVVPRLADWLARFEVRLAALEKVGAMPGQGVVSMFSFGQNVGAWQGILAALGIPTSRPGPRNGSAGSWTRSQGRTRSRHRWRRHAGCSPKHRWSGRRTMGVLMRCCWRGGHVVRGSERGRPPRSTLHRREVG